MDMQIIADIIQLSLPTGLVVVSVWWVLSEGWPYWKERDRLTTLRDYERDMAALDAQKETASATVALADAITKLCVCGGSRVDTQS
jgi:hypothetical protein